MLRKIITLFLLLIIFDTKGQSKIRKSYSIPPSPIEFDSTSFENIRQNENIKIISDSLILISRESNVDNEGSELYFKKENTIWYGIHLDYEHIKIDLVNLDNKGKPELILNCYAYAYGSGGGNRYGAFIVINIDSIPIELMNVKFSCFEEAFGHINVDNSITTQAYSESFERNISCKNRSIIVTPNNLTKLKKFKKITGVECVLTKIPSGIYTMIDGRLTLRNK